jgi:endonuclease YncB( thermonuclease family)
MKDTLARRAMDRHGPTISARRSALLAARALGTLLVAALMSAGVPAAAGAATAAGAPETADERIELLEGRIVGITDGDTLTLLVDEQPVRVRLAQIDAPERGQPYGSRAKAALSQLGFGKPARVEILEIDNYGRRIGEVFVGGVHLNQELVRQGHAWAYTRYARSTAIIDLENEARAAGRGLWRLPEASRDAPWEWRRQRRRERSSAAERAPQPDRTADFRCGAKQTCREMQSCREARFHLERCDLQRLDGDRDGVPCESLCSR